MNQTTIIGIHFSRLDIEIFIPDIYSTWKEKKKTLETLFFKKKRVKKKFLGFWKKVKLL